ncbi:dienelactone hydrolase family protein [Brevundimonas sp.]|jgi:phospholipase/carboxylesterase|uniref:dienelactone hydrolase family protein n=1 Tax=Brevundimonas sp. TaxID=1871086 RepID=UPI0037C17F2D
MTDLVFQADAAPPRRLIVLLHGVGSSARDMAGIGEGLAQAVPGARVLVPDGFDPFDGGGAGRQWFSVRGVTPQNRTARIDSVLPRLLDWIEARRGEAGLSPEAVGLFGFSQGAILSLAAAAQGYAAGAVVAAAGRLAVPVVPPTPASPGLLLLHGQADGVIPAAEGEDAARHLAEAGYGVQIRTEPGLGHGVSPTQIRDAAAWFDATLST